MRRLILLSLILAVFASAFCAKTVYTYRLVTGNGEPVAPYVFSNTPNKYGYKIQLSPSYGGSAPAIFEVSLENGKFPDGKTKKDDIYPNEVITIIWDDVPNVNGVIKIAKGIADNTLYELKTGDPIQISHKIASLKGQTPNMTLSPTSNPAMGSKSVISGQLSDAVIFPGIMIKNNWGVTTNLTAQRYEWALPAGWKTNTGKSGTFIVGEQEKNISIIPDYFTQGEVKVRAMNDFDTAGSEYKIYTADRAVHTRAILPRTGKNVDIRLARKIDN